MWDHQVVRLFTAAKQGQVKILREHGESASTYFDAVDPLGNSLAHWATKGGQVKVLRYLKATYPWTLSARNLFGQQPIHIGCVAGKFMCVAFLAHSLAAFELPDFHGRTPLLLAAQHGHTDIVAYLLLHSANIHASDDEQNGALHLAAKAGYVNICSLLISFGVNPETQLNASHQTPLHLASENGHLSVVQQLCKCINKQSPFQQQIFLQKDKHGQTPINVAHTNGWSEVADYLRSELLSGMVKRRRSCNLVYLAMRIKKFLFGPPGRRHFGVIGVYVVLLCILYPFYWIQILHSGFTLTDSKASFIWILLNPPSWICFYMSKYKNPGYLPQNTSEYQSVLKMAKHAVPRGTLDSSNFPKLFDVDGRPHLAITEDMANTKHDLASLCHTCRCVKPLRSKHCWKCDRCVEVFDHHCPLTNRCIGYRNRVWFFGLCGLTSFLSTTMAILLWLQTTWELTRIPTIFCTTVLFSVWSCSTYALANALHCMLRNVTTNEMINWTRYSYLRGESGRKMRKSFDRGMILNMCEYFGVRSRSYPKQSMLLGTEGSDV